MNQIERGTDKVDEGIHDSFLAHQLCEEFGNGGDLNIGYHR
jgi:hypothetical protein